jgi:hypothetical protein
VLRITKMVDPLSDRVDRLQRLVLARTSPILTQLGPMSERPFSDKPQRSGRELSRDHGHALNIDRCLVAAIPGMEVRPTEMMTLVVIHPDRDPVERADPRHMQRIFPAIPVSFASLSENPAAAEGQQAG